MELGWSQNRHNDDRFPKALESWISNSKRKPGRPTSKWKDEIVEHGSIFCRRKAQDRSKWRKMGTSFII
jgi:hypothetical protein